MTTAPRPREHLDFLDGLRALLALYVVQRHAEVYFFHVTDSHRDKTLSLWTPMRYAHFAVDIFIVISGFCLFLPVVRAALTLRGGAGTFFKRRAIRILPPYYASVAISLAGLAVAGQSAQFTGKNMSKVWHHLLLTHDAFTPFSINSALWSVAVECHIYLLFPILILSFRRIGAAATLGWVAVISAALYALVLRTPYRVVTPQYLFLFALGMLGAALYTSAAWDRIAKAPWGVIAAVLILGSMTVHHYAPQRLVDRYLGVEDAFVGVGAMALLLAAARPGPARTVLSLRPLVWAGGFSYSIYLAHVPVLETLVRLTGWDFSNHGGVLKLAEVAGLVAVAAAASYVFYLAFERPAVNALSAQKKAAQPAPSA